MHKLFMLVFLTCLLAGGASATVITFSGPGCTTCLGSAWTLTVNPLSPIEGNDAFEVMLIADTSGYTGTGVKITEVAPKITSSLVSFTLTSAPGGLGLWSAQFGGINANGCYDAGSGFGCASTLFNAAPLTNSPNTWVFNMVAPPGSLINPSLKWRLEDVNGNMAGPLGSEHSGVPEVPEPVTFALIGSGLLALGLVHRKSLSK